MMRSPAKIQLQPLVRERQWCRDDIPVLELKLSVPHCVAIDGRNRRINRYYESFARSCEQYARRFLLPAAEDDFTAAVSENRPVPLWYFHIAFSTHLLCDTLWSLSIETEESTFTVPYRRRYADTWDLTSGYPLSLSDLFPSEPLHRRRLREHARKELRQRQAQGIALHESWQRRLSSAWNRENFYLTEEGLHWFYPMYALGGEELGFPDFFLPWRSGENPCTALFPLDKGKQTDIS